MRRQDWLDQQRLDAMRPFKRRFRSRKRGRTAEAGARRSTGPNASTRRPHGRVVAARSWPPSTSRPSRAPPWTGTPFVAADTRREPRTRPAPCTSSRQVFTGQVPAHAVHPGTCTEIATGAPLPAGGCCRDGRRNTEATSTSARVEAVCRGQNIGRKGADILAGRSSLSPRRTAQPESRWSRGGHRLPARGRIRASPGRDSVNRQRSRRTRDTAERGSDLRHQPLHARAIVARLTAACPRRT